MVVVAGVYSNNQYEHPAVVNCVHSEMGDVKIPDPYYMANVTVFPDCAVPQPATSIYVFENRAQAMKYREITAAPNLVVAFWPDRVEEKRRDLVPAASN